MSEKNIEVSTLSSEALASVVMPKGPSVASEPKIVLYTEAPEIQNLRAHCPVPQENIDWLRADIKARGVTDSIKYYVLEDGRNMVLDGYTRIEICNGENLPYNTQKLEFPSRKAAINWFIDSQLKRRNLTGLQIAFLNGNRYRAVKQSHGGDRRSRARDVHLKDAGKKPSKEIAKELKTTTKTLREHAEFAKSLGKIKDAVGPKFTQDVLGGHTKTKLTIKAIEALAKKTPDEIKADVGRILNGDKLTQPKQQISDDKKFAEFDKRQQALLDTLRDVTKISDTSEVDFDLVLETTEDILNEIERIEENSTASS
jgi:hypothetical protein